MAANPRTAGATVSGCQSTPGRWRRTHVPPAPPFPGVRAPCRGGTDPKERERHHFRVFGHPRAVAAWPRLGGSGRDRRYLSGTVTPVPVRLGSVTSDALTVNGQVEARRSSGATFGVLATGAGVFALLQSLVTPVLPTLPARAAHLTDHGHLGADRLPALGLDVHADPRTHRRHGRQEEDAGRALLALVVGSLLAPLATNSIGVMIVARVIQGIGGAVFPLCLRHHPRRVPAARRSPARWASAALLAVGGGLGIVLAGPIVGALDYHWLFWIPLIMHRARRRRGPLRGARVAGAHRRARSTGSARLLLSAWLVALLLAVSEGIDLGLGLGKSSACSRRRRVRRLWGFVEPRSSRR